ncbi:MAG: 3-deoxy-7-phosphoheptulonate synthase, partial [candidate division Zixibacteria bacterium]|nr:3-deoxy-7-phosphoheptulonate synthase [candidate division Zixibacteria bacterium]
MNVTAGPCAVEDEAQLAAVAEFLHRCDVRFLRGGAYKPRTQVDSFQ